jgi:putative DNA primase/helicase
MTFPNTIAASQNCWLGILPHYGLNDDQLSRKHTSCPLCGGKDRFRFDDKYKHPGDGGYFCNQCGSGNGFNLVMQIRGIDFKSACKEIDELLGNVKPVTKTLPEKSVQEIQSKLKRIFTGAVRDIGNPYLANRGITVKPDIWYHKSCEYWDNDKQRAYHQAMLGIVTSPNGRKLAIHRTYLTLDGRKASVKPNKKLTKVLEPLAGSAIRLFDHGEVLGVAEGIETACAAFQLTGIPTWSVLNTSGMKSFVVPAELKKLIIFADHDSNQAGQKAAYELASRCNVACEVRIPEIADTDWADVLESML